MTPDVAPDADTAAAQAARHVAEALSGRDVAHLALSGGSIMATFHERLAAEDVDWSTVHLWFSDERAVGPDDDDSNFKAAKGSLLDRISGATVHRVLGEWGADPAAAAYAEEVEGVTFDVIMCGMGPDGHTCSLFPGHPEVHETERLVVAVHDAPKPPPDRISFTMPLLHAARETVLLAAGEEKADAMTRVLAGPDPATPASLLGAGALTVFTDSSAVRG